MARRAWAGVWGSVAGLCLGIPVGATEQISVFYPPLFEVSISVATLETFALDGEITGELRFYSRFFNDDQLEAAREVLIQPFEISHVALSQIAYSPVGERLLRNLSPVLLTGSEETNIRALRGALVVAAAQPEGLTVLNFLRALPFERVRLDLQLSIQALNAAIEIVTETEAAIAQVQAQAGVSVTIDSPLARLGEVGSLNYERQEISFFHPERGIPMLADLYVPLGLEQPAPLVVISHGIASDRQTFAYLARHLASHGFGVGVIEHPGTNASQLSQFLAGFDQLPDSQEWIHRPRDISYFLDAIAEDPSLLVDPNRVGLIGQSLGGYTVLAAAGAVLNRAHLQQQCADRANLSFNISLLLQCRATAAPSVAEDRPLRDPRVQAVMALNPIAGTLFGPEGMGEIEIPTLMLSSTLDVFAPPLTEQLRPFDWLQTEKRYLVLVEEGTHFTYLGGRGQGVLPVPDLLVGPNPALAFPQLQAIATAFLGSYLREDPEPFDLLTSAHVAGLSRDPLRLSLVVGDVGIPDALSQVVLD